MLFFRRMSMAHQNWRALEVEPRQILGSAVHFDTAHRPVYASDASNYRQVPIGVVTPRSMEDFIRGVAICERQQAPVLVRGGGTSMTGQTVNVAVCSTCRCIAMPSSNSIRPAQPR
jgi:FAD/FMN-containing dehydrogenase